MPCAIVLPAKSHDKNAAHNTASNRPMMPKNQGQVLFVGIMDAECRQNLERTKRCDGIDAVEVRTLHGTVQYSIRTVLSFLFSSPFFPSESSISKQQRLTLDGPEDKLGDR